MSEGQEQEKPTIAELEEIMKDQGPSAVQVLPIGQVRVKPRPTPGRIVLYKLSGEDAAQAHIGNAPREGDLVPLLIIRVWSDDPLAAVNGQAFLDGNDVLWVTSRLEGTAPGTWSWPPRS